MSFIAPPLLATLEETKKLLETELSPIRANLQSIEKKFIDLKTSVDYMLGVSKVRRSINSAWSLE